MGNEKTLIPTLTRRNFIRFGAATASCFYSLPLMQPLNVWASSRVDLRGTAEYCIFLFLNGGPSQIDTFDFKEGSWSPPDFDLRTMKGGNLKLPYGLFPRLAEKLDDLAIVRSVEAWESAHSRAQYYLQVAHPVSPARFNEMPSVGAVIAYEMEERRKTSDFLPSFVTMNYGKGIGSGCLDVKYNPLAIDTKKKLNFILDDSERNRFDRRWDLLRKLEWEGQSHQETSSRPIEEFKSHYVGANSMMLTPQIGNILELKEEEQKSYGESALGDACILARNLISAEAGTRYAFISHAPWDFHNDQNDKDKPSNHYTVCRELDTALASLLTDLGRIQTKKGERLLDKTLIVCMGEFGRTVGDLTVNKGRDHWRNASSALFAGGGVQGGQIIGATDATGGKIIDPGGTEASEIYTEDVIATMYSTLGIDWKKKITNTPSGRAFEYLESVSGTTFLDVDEIKPLFT